MTAVLTADELTIGAEAPIVHPLSFCLRAGMPLTIVGETGSGKSLLAQAIMGNLPSGLITGGRVHLDGQCISDLPAAARRALWGRRMALLPQEPWLALDPLMRASGQIREAYRWVRGLSRPAAGTATDRDLAALGLEDAAGRLPGALSGGMAQRVAFAAARAGGAQLVIADEPTKGLDADRRDEAVQLLLHEVEAGGALLTITHDIAVARRLGGEVIVMRDGRVVERGAAATVLERPRSDYARQLVAAEPAAWTDTPRGVPGEPVIRADDLALSRGGRRVLEGVDLAIAAGEIVGVTGPSGCGKSSLGDALLGVLSPDGGTVWRTPGVARLRFQKLYQDPPAAFAPHWPIKTALSDLVRRHQLAWSDVVRWMQRLRLAPELLERPPGSISGGELQRFALLRVLMLDPVFLVADEPTSRLDMITQQATMHLIVELARERHCGVLLISHDTDLVRKVADRHLVIGRQAAASLPSVFTSPALAYG